MSLNVKTKRTVSALTPRDLEQIVQRAVRQALHDEIKSVRVDPRGYLIFPNEQEYAAYLKTQPDKLPSEVKAYFIDPQGFRVHYSDYELTPKKARELANRKDEPAVPHDVVRERLRKLGVRV